jgi:uncharacterized coiled-coil protein SlyX
MNVLIQSTEPLGERKQYGIDFHSGKPKLISESPTAVSSTYVDKTGSYVRNFHLGVTGAGRYEDRMMHYMVKGDKSVTAFADTKSLR